MICFIRYILVFDIHSSKRPDSDEVDFPLSDYCQPTESLYMIIHYISHDFRRIE